MKDEQKTEKERLTCPSCNSQGEADYIRQLKDGNKHHFEHPLANNCSFCGRYISNVAEGNKPVGNHDKTCELTALKTKLKTKKELMMGMFECYIPDIPLGQLFKSDAPSDPCGSTGAWYYYFDRMLMHKKSKTYSKKIRITIEEM